MSAVLRWEDPPPSSHGPGGTKWDAVLEVLRERPGEWALVLENVNVANAYGLKKRYGSGGFEFTSRVQDGDRRNGRIYARFAGGAS